MGRKAGQLYLNPKRFASMNKPCMKEMISLLNCLSLNHLNDEKCAEQKKVLTTCMEAQTSSKKKAFGSINYHLQRLNKGRK